MINILFFYKNTESLGIEYLSSILKQHGHNTDLIFDFEGDEFGFSFLNFISHLNKEVIDYKIREFKPDLIAFSVMTDIFPWVSKIATYIKKNYNIPIVLGGPHPTIAPEYVIQKDFVDYILIGESEKNIIPFIERLAHKKQPSGIPGIWYKNENGTIIKNPLSPLVEDLDSIPFPDKNLFYKFGVKEPYIIIAGRGCPNNCTYCINNVVHKLYPKQRYIRRRTPKNVVEELLWAKKRFKIRRVLFADDDFLADIKWLRQLAVEFKKTKLKLNIKIIVNSVSVTEEKIRLVKEIGCTTMVMGVESGSPKIRRTILDRKMSNNKIINAINIIHKYGLHVDTLNMINIPGEEIRDMIKTLVFNRKLRPDGIHIVSVYPYPGTYISDIAEDKGIFDESIRKMTLEGMHYFRDESLFHHPHKEIGEKIRTLGFIYVKFPRFMRKLFIYLPQLKIFGRLNTIFMTHPINIFHRFLDIFTLLIKYNAYYRGIQKSMTIKKQLDR